MKKRGQMRRLRKKLGRSKEKTKFNFTGKVSREPE